MNDGLFNRDCKKNPYWCNATQVYVPYCSSDSWVGDRDASLKSLLITFKGSRIIDAVLDKVSKTLLKDHTDSKEILWSGCSAGGRGAAFNMHKVQKVFPNARALNDSDWWTDMPPIKSSITSFTTMVQKAHELTNGQLDPECVKNFENEPWQCMFNYKAEPFYKMPRMTQGYLYDQYGLGIDTNGGMNMNPSVEMKSYAEDWRKFFENSLKVVQRPESHLFAPGCYHHCSTETSVMYEVKVKGRSLAGYLGDWMEGKLEEKDLVLKDDCKGFNCGEGCPEAKTFWGLGDAKSERVISLSE